MPFYEPPKAGVEKNQKEPNSLRMSVVILQRRKIKTIKKERKHHGKIGSSEKNTKSFIYLKQQNMESKVKVYAKSHNRIALGVINAYLVLYPETTLDDLRKAFPNTINPDCGSKQIFMTLK